MEGDEASLNFYEYYLMDTGVSQVRRKCKVLHTVLPRPCYMLLYAIHIYKKLKKHHPHHQKASAAAMQTKNQVTSQVSPEPSQW